MEMPKPSSGHARLEELAGAWEGEEQMYPSPWDPKGGTAIGRTNTRVALGGFALIGDYEQERGGHITYAGHVVWTYNPKSDICSLNWFDSMGSPPEVFTGRFEGKVITVAHGGPGTHARLTYDLSEPGILKTKMEMSQDGAAWATFFDGRYARR